MTTSNTPPKSSLILDDLGQPDREGWAVGLGTEHIGSAQSRRVVLKKTGARSFWLPPEYAEHLVATGIFVPDLADRISASVERIHRQMGDTRQVADLKRGLRHGGLVRTEISKAPQRPASIRVA